LPSVVAVHSITASAERASALQHPAAISAAVTVGRCDLRQVMAAAAAERLGLH
jgi:hypothetical protein